MAYTRVWTANVSGSSPANTIDTLISNVRVDLAERLGAVLNNVTDDPVSVRNDVRGKVTGKRMLIPFTSFIIEPSEINQFEYNDNWLTVSAAAQSVRASIILPNTITIKKIRWLVTSDDANTVTLKLQSAPFATGTSVPTDENIQLKSIAGQQLMDSGVITIVVGTGKYYWLYASKGSGSAFAIYGAEIQYDTPDSRSTL